MGLANQRAMGTGWSKGDGHEGQVQSSRRLYRGEPYQHPLQWRDSDCLTAILGSPKSASMGLANQRAMGTGCSRGDGHEGHVQSPRGRRAHQRR
jgi:hypothetical protein